jgi:hypothetical protein
MCFRPIRIFIVKSFVFFCIDWNGISKKTNKVIHCFIHLIRRAIHGLKKANVLLYKKKNSIVKKTLLIWTTASTIMIDRVLYNKYVSFLVGQIICSFAQWITTIWNNTISLQMIDSSHRSSFFFLVVVVIFFFFLSWMCIVGGVNCILSFFSLYNFKQQFSRVYWKIRNTKLCFTDR